MPTIRIREKGQVTIPYEILQEWNTKNHVQINDTIEAVLANGVLILIPKKRHASKRDMLSFAGTGKGVWGKTGDEIDSNLKEIRQSWKK
jgi:hypothetical protein